MPCELLRLSRLPVYQNKMFPSAAQARACERGDVVLVQHPQSGIVHNAAFDPQLLSYDQSYQNEQGHSPAFHEHLEEVLGLIGSHFGGSTLLEVGCGKGAFLAMLRQRGHSAIGIDPAYEGSDPYILREYLSPAGDQYAEAVVLRHTLEHVADPLAFLSLIRDSNRGTGLIYIEVPCLDWILSHRAWFDFFYEHVNYFRLADFERLFGKVLTSGRLFGGQYLFAIADLATLRPMESLPNAETVVFPADLFLALDAGVGSTQVAHRNVVWGAAAKGVMFAHHSAQRKLPLEFAIDINPAKQGGFLAGTGLAVLSPEAGLARLSDGDQVFVMNSNYLGEIARAGGNRLQYTTLDSP